VIAALLIVILAGTATTVVAGTASNAHSRGVVLFVGDSNVTLSASQIVGHTTLFDHYNDPYLPVFASRVGAAIRTEDCLDKDGCTTFNYWQIKLGETMRDVQPDAIVNDLGINDTVGAGTATTPGYRSYGQKIDWFMRLIPQTTPVFWSNLACAIEPADRQTGCKAVNEALSAARTRWPNFVLVNWAAPAHAHPEYLLHVNKPYVHYSAAGSSAWIALVTAAMDARMPAAAG
jgi:hypothetical protein